MGLWSHHQINKLSYLQPSHYRNIRLDYLELLLNPDSLDRLVLLNQDLDYLEDLYHPAHLCLSGLFVHQDLVDLDFLDFPVDLGFLDFPVDLDYLEILEGLFYLDYLEILEDLEHLRPDGLDYLVDLDYLDFLVVLLFLDFQFDLDYLVHLSYRQVALYFLHIYKLLYQRLKEN